MSNPLFSILTSKVNSIISEYAKESGLKETQIGIIYAKGNFYIINLSDPSNYLKKIW